MCLHRLLPSNNPLLLQNYGDVARIPANIGILGIKSSSTTGIMSSTFKAHVDSKPRLEWNSLAGLCKPFIEGYCRMGTECPLAKSHIICLVAPESPRKAEEMKTTANILSPGPRKNPTDLDKFFDSDGPGTLSVAREARHDNDHISIQDVRILPTTDEV
jgi:hypothetical protein